MPFIQPPVGQEGAKDNAVDAHVPAQRHLPEKLLFLSAGEAEVAEPRPNEHIHRDGHLRHHRFDEGKGRRHTADGQVAAQLQPVGAALLGGQGGLQGVHADFQQAFHIRLL